MQKYKGELGDIEGADDALHNVIAPVVEELLTSGGVVFTCDPEKVLAAFGNITSALFALVRDKLVDAVGQQVDFTTQVYEHWGEHANNVLKAALHESISEAFRYASPNFLKETGHARVIREHTPSVDELDSDNKEVRRVYREPLDTRGGGRFAKKTSDGELAAKREELEAGIIASLRKYGPDAEQWRIADAIFYQGPDVGTHFVRKRVSTR